MVAAEYAGCTFDRVAVQFGQTNKTADYLSKFPFGRVPALETAEGPLFESSAIAYLAAEHKPALLGKTPYERALVQQWLLVADNEVMVQAARWVYPILGYAPYHQEVHERAIEDCRKALKTLDTILLPRTFLVGNSVTLADICMISSLSLLYRTVLDAAERKSLVNLTRYFVTVVNQPEYLSVLGGKPFPLCEQAAVYTPKVEEEEVAAPAVSHHAAAGGAEDDEDEEAEKPQKEKPKNPLDLLPKSKLNLEEWKRFYSNNDTRPTALNWFWQNYDAEGYSIWRVDYKYNSELTKTWMSANLIGGWYQRMELLRKYCFASLCVLGEDNANEISGYMVFRGLDIPAEMRDTADFDSFEFKRVNIDDAHERDLIGDYFAWDGKFEGKKFADGKIFK